MAFVNLGQVMYPVGAYFFSDSSISPSNLFGGIWTAVDAGRFICAAGSEYRVGQQGGKNTVALVCNELPAAVWFSNGVSGGPYQTDINAAVDPGRLYGIHTTNRATANMVGNAHENRPLYRAANIWRRIS